MPARPALRGRVKIAVLGTGLMGAPMTRRLAAAGHVVAVWNRSADKAAALADVARVAADPADAVAGAVVVISMLQDGVATRAVLHDQGTLAACAAGTTIIDMGSVDPATDRALAAVAADLGLRFLDAPVSGGVVGAVAGTLSIFVGGDADTLASVAEVLAVLGRPTLLGPVGAGQVTKLANQLIVACTIGAVAEGLRLAQVAGCDPALVRQALLGGFADSRILDLHGARMVAGDYAPGGRSAVQLKDLINAHAVADAAGIDLPLSRTAMAAFDDLVHRQGGGELDHAAYFLWLERRMGS